MKQFVSVLLVLAPFSAQAATSNEANLIAIGQGISSPTLTSTVNYSSGYTHESPIGVVYQNSWRVTGQYDTNYENDNNNGNGNNGNGNGRDSYGAELGFGNGGTAGLAAGYYTRNCDNCEGRLAGSGAVVVGAAGIGLRVQENLYTGAVLFNPQGSHRVGLIAEMNGDNGDGNDLTSYGAGYSYVATDWTFTLDASKRDHENSSTNSERILLTPGIMMRADFLQLSVNDKITLNNREAGSSSGDDTHHELWVGVGVGGQNWHVAGYANYVNDFSFALSLLF